MVKLEPGGEELTSQPWSSADAEFRLGAAGERRGCTPPPETPFLHAKVREEEASHAAPYSGLEPPDHRRLEEALAHEYSAASAEFEFNMAAVDNCGGVGGGAQNCFICSTCGRSFDCFDSFQEHRCNDGAGFS
ncbi:hypothetical protein EYF80_067570 [Liparis tanakae]|uniref:Uncharacterized protein n=1 Tax=Liparis tanakae TaxID=230148 RepID=A0A4Z2E0I7_9TELE|nr:hypothetical protein EYF80_067570 [Liparis tanakae]